MIFSRKHNFALGLDITDTAVRAVQSRLSRDNIKLQALGCLPLESGIIQNEEIKNPEKLVKKLIELLARPKLGSFSTNEVVAKLPASASYVKYISIEDGPNNLADMVANEIEKHIPLAKKDMYYDYQSIKKGKNSNYVLLGAASRAVVDQYVAILKAAKLEISALEIASACDCRALITDERRPSQKQKISALINIADINSSLAIYAENTIILSISMPISSHNTTEQIAKTLEIKHEQAKKALVVCGLDKNQANGIVYDILVKMIDDLIDRVNSAFEFLSTHYPAYTQIDEILLYGAGANIKNLDIIMSKKLNIPARIASPLLHFKEDEQKISSIAGDFLAGYTSAIGLSLRNLFLAQK